MVQSVSMNAAMNMLTINGRDVDSVQKMLRQLTYVNNRLFPTPATRPLTVETHIKYARSLHTICRSLWAGEFRTIPKRILAITALLTESEAHMHQYEDAKSVKWGQDVSLSIRISTE